MRRIVLEDREALGKHAAQLGAEHIRDALRRKGEASIILATGASQFNTLSYLVTEPNVEWSRVTMFHLDEYIGLSDQHPASFRRYLRERFVQKVPSLKAVHWINGDAPDVEAEALRLDKLILGTLPDVAMVGIGENGHLAFNDPPADFTTEKPYIVVELDEACRRQQMGEGWFDSIDAVPRRAISMSVNQIMKSPALVVTVPDRRKAEAVRNTVTGPVTPEVPASVIQKHPECVLVLDAAAASLLQ